MSAVPQTKGVMVVALFLPESVHALADLGPTTGMRTESRSSSDSHGAVRITRSVDLTHAV